jgi:hypothetical protein
MKARRKRPVHVGQDERSASEGWCIIDNEDGTFSIEADHDSPIFCRDGVAYNDEALAYVKGRADEGSIYHRCALKKCKNDSRRQPAPECPHCRVPHNPRDENESNSTWQQWQCIECGQWVDRELAPA